MQGEKILRKGTNRQIDFLRLFSPSTSRLSSVSEQRFNTTAVWKINHKLVVAWQLLEAVCQVLLTRGGIARKGLTAKWLSTVCQFVQR